MMTREELLDCFKDGKQAILLYSGGKDSLACLSLLKPVWDQVDVVWVDTGCVFPEIHEHIKKVKAMVPKFTTLKSDVVAYWKENGLPVDVVPIKYTAYGQSMFGHQKLRFCSTMACCNANMWMPMNNYINSIRPDYVIKGDRKKERSYPVQECPSDIALLTPVWGYTDEEIHNVIEQELPELLETRHFLPGKSSLDCQYGLCYFNYLKPRLLYIKERHPELFAESKNILEEYLKIMDEQLRPVKEVIK